MAGPQAIDARPTSRRRWRLCSASQPSSSRPRDGRCSPSRAPQRTPASHLPRRYVPSDSKASSSPPLRRQPRSKSSDQLVPVRGREYPSSSRTDSRRQVARSAPVSGGGPASAAPTQAHAPAMRASSAWRARVTRWFLHIRHQAIRRGHDPQSSERPPDRPRPTQSAPVMRTSDPCRAASSARPPQQWPLPSARRSCRCGCAQSSLPCREPRRHNRAADRPYPRPSETPRRRR